MRIAVLTPAGEGQLGVSFAAALSHEGHDAEVVAAAQLTGGSRPLVLARRVRLDGALSATLRRPIERRLAELRPDVTLVVKGRFLGARDVEALRRVSGGRIVNYFPDNPFYPEFYEDAVMGALAAYDATFIWSRDLVARLRAAGVSRCRYLPFGYDDRVYGRSESDQPRAWQVGFVGQWSELRERHVRALAGLRVGLAGPGWSSRLGADAADWCTVVPGSPHGPAAADVLRRSAVGLNILHPQNVGAHNMRTWEAPSTGRACAMTASAFHDDLFGEEGIAAFDGPGDVRAAVERLLEDDSVRARVAAAGEAAVRPGTYRARMREMLAILEGAP